jgi:signal transduction histidine kinase/transcriptional regulator with GAF, ATPase, and Fis domain
MSEAKVDHTAMTLNDLSRLNQITLELCRTLELEPLLDQLLRIVQDFVGTQQTLILVLDEQENFIKTAATNFQSLSSEPHALLKTLQFDPYRAEPASLLESWLQHKALVVEDSHQQNHPSFKSLLGICQATQVLTNPLFSGDQLIGAVITANATNHQPITPEQEIRLEELARSAEIAVQNARIYQKTVHDLADSMREMYILRQIDRELMDTIELNHVFEITLDWALRFTNAQAASLALYDEDRNSLQFLMDYGYDLSPDRLATLRSDITSGLTMRVAMTGQADTVPNVHLDPDYLPLMTAIQSQLAVPVMREDRVIAVITLESKKSNGFNESHLDFVQKLGMRAGVAIDNARLYEESLREREKLSHILNHTADVVIVLSTDRRIMLINQAALRVLQVRSDTNHLHAPAESVFGDTALGTSFNDIKETRHGKTCELVMPDERIFHANFRWFENIGWIIVMHDITPFKEMDRLKSELIATVSHDLKQPLSVMNGYIDLILIQQAVSGRGINAMHMIRKSMQTMRQLIDDLLDLAKIESGIQLKLETLDLPHLLQDCVEQLRSMADNKSQRIILQIPEHIHSLQADKSRIHQVLINLIGNAIKYTDERGWIKIWAEADESLLRISVQDNGMGIAPEDQMHIFDRFYRVRRPETDEIEGTGLGLAIVKSLVEAHNATIELESELGTGSTFVLTFPRIA